MHGNGLELFVNDYIYYVLYFGGMGPSLSCTCKGSPLGNVARVYIVSSVY